MWVTKQFVEHAKIIRVYLIQQCMLIMTTTHPPAFDTDALYSKLKLQPLCQANLKAPNYKWRFLELLLQHRSGKLSKPNMNVLLIELQQSALDHFAQKTNKSNHFNAAVILS